MLRQILAVAVSFAVWCCLGAMAWAEPDPEPPPRWFVAMRGGALLPIGGMDTGMTVGAEVGRALPVLDGQTVWAAVALDYASRSADGTGTDPGVGGSYLWSLASRKLALSLLGHGRFEAAPVTPYGSLGASLAVVDARANGSAGGQPFGETAEASLTVAAVAAAGVDVPLGGGSLGAEVRLTVEGMSLAVTGDTVAVALGLLVSYRLWL